MITAFQDEVSIASREVSEYLENQVAAIAPETFEYIHPVFREEAAQLTAGIGQAARTTIESAIEVGRKLIQAKEKFTRPKEFSRFRSEQDVSPTDARKSMQLFERFGSGWDIEKLVLIHSVTSIFSLCHSKFDEVVEELKQAATLTREYVQRLVKEVRERDKVERKTLQLEDPVTGWQQDPSGGTRRYSINLYDEETGVAVERLAQEKNCLPHRVIAEAIAAFEQTPPIAEETLARKQLMVELEAERKSRVEAQSELRGAVEEMRSRHIEMEKRLISQEQEIKLRDARIAELSKQLADMGVTQSQTKVLAPAPKFLEIGAMVQLEVPPSTESIADSIWEVVGIRGDRISVSLDGGKPVLTHASNVRKILDNAEPRKDSLEGAFAIGSVVRHHKVAGKGFPRREGGAFLS